MKLTEGIVLKRHPIRCSIVDIKDVNAESYRWQLWAYHQYHINHPLLGWIKEKLGYISPPKRKPPKYVEVSRVEL